MCRILLSVVLCCVFLRLASAYEFGGNGGEGKSCDQDGQVGTCTRTTSCHVYTERGEWWKLKICGFIGYEAVICCPTRATTTTTTTTTPKPVVTTPPMGISGLRDYGDYDDASDCMGLPPHMTTEPTGIKSWDKCREYQLKLVYRCDKFATDLGFIQRIRFNYCRHFSAELFVGSTDADRDEFPHMVLLGYGRSNGSAVWQCGGTLISDRFILTAAHCTRIKTLGYVNYVIVRSHIRSTDDVQPWQVHRIKRIIKHPDFNPRTKQNDIALLETDPIPLDYLTVPACLDVFGGDRDRVVATGWGATSYMGDDANTLQKVILEKFTDRECSDHSRPRWGTFNSSIQVCYGDHHNASTCQGDSGGPLTIRNHRLHCMYTVVGITSFLPHCRTPGVPDWYTKVAPYVPWIESIVWP